MPALFRSESSSISNDSRTGQTHTESSTDKFPVLVFIHGGAFLRGCSANSIQGAALASAVNDNPVVVVTINYRMGPFGFLGNEMLRDRHDGSTGNLGILDQRLALEWVQTHIAKFGGDPNRVTIAGQSAGASAVSVHLTSKPSWPLFHQAVMLSGGFIPAAAVSLHYHEHQANALAEKVGCGTGIHIYMDR